MGIYIPDVKLPPDKKYKWDLVLHISYDGTVRSPWGYLITDEKAIELPPHGRLIDADAFLARNAYFADRDFVNPKYDDTLKDLIDRADTILPADPEGVRPVVQGEWLPFRSQAAGNIQYCSSCGIGSPEKTDYCPHCGAKMRPEGGTP